MIRIIKGIKRRITRPVLVGLAVLVALSVMGVSYAARTDTMKIKKVKDHYVATQGCSDPFTWVVSNDDGHEDTIIPYGLIDPGDTEFAGDPGAVPAPLAPPNPGDAFPRYDKDVATTEAWLGTVGPEDPDPDRQYITLLVGNAYPFYYSTVFFALECGPSAAGVIQDIVIETDFIDDELTVDYSGIEIWDPVPTGGEAVGALHILVNQAAEQGAIYTVTLSITTVCEEAWGDCAGKVTELTLRYNGTAAASVRVVQKQNPQCPDDGTVFDDTVEPGGEFTFNGTCKWGTLGVEIHVFKNDVLAAIFHTSCSQDIGPGLVVGEFEVVRGESRNGGPLPPVPW